MCLDLVIYVILMQKTFTNSNRPSKILLPNGEMKRININNSEFQGKAKNFKFSRFPTLCNEKK